MSPKSLDTLLDALRTSLREQDLERSVVKTWVFQDICCVAEFSHKGARIGFDLTPSKSGVTLDVVPRDGLETAARFNAQFPSKTRLLTNASLPAATQKMSDIFEDLSKELDAVRKKQRLKVGVLTLPLSNNYGNNLQAFALIDTVRGLGHEAILINRRTAFKEPSASKAQPSKKAKAPLTTKNIDIESEFSDRAAFINEHIGPVSVQFEDSKQLAESIDRYGFDAIIVGSDQVWRPKFAKPMLGDFLLTFLKDDSPTRRISYAASFGTEKWEYPTWLTNQSKPFIAKFDAVSVREDSAVALCREHFDRHAQHVLDPTLLVPRERYIEVFRAKVPPQLDPRIVTYILDPSPDKTALLNALSGTLDLPVHGVDGQRYESLDPLAGAPEAPNEHWLSEIHSASFVVTDSFHGMVFSILFQRPFIVYANRSRGMARFTSLLTALGLRDRLVESFSPEVSQRAMAPIDWEAVQERLDHMRSVSMTFLQEGLTGESKDAGKPIAPSTLSAAPVLSSVPHALGVHCTGCGVCVSEARGTLEMAWNTDGFRVPVAVSKKVDMQARRVCPFNPSPEPEVANEDVIGRTLFGDARNYEADAGHYERAYIGYSNAFRSSSSSGGMATYLFERILTLGLVDCLFVVRGDAAGGYSYARFDKSEDIRTMSKTRYVPVSMEQLFEIIDNTTDRIAISGVACFIKAIRLKQHYNPELKQRIPFLIGIVCGGLKSKHYTDFLASSAGVSGHWSSAEYRVKNPKRNASDYSFSVSDEQQKQHHLRMRNLGDMWGAGLFKSKACDYCTDVLTELADVSLGDAWLPAYNRDGLGNSVVVTRSLLADSLIQSGMLAGELTLAETPISEVVRSQQGGLDHKQKGLKFRKFLAAQNEGVSAPNVRPRVLCDVTAGYMLVQILRERVRSKSIRHWNETGIAQPFSRRMMASRRLLDDVTVLRKQHAQTITELARTALANPYALPQTEFASARLMLRWFRLKVHTGEISVDNLRDILPEELLTSLPPKRRRRRAK